MVTIKDGKFYKDGVFMPAEFGNKEQIAAMEEFGKYDKELKSGMELEYWEEVNVTYTAEFKCFCGLMIRLEDESQDEGSPECLTSSEIKCRCGKHKYDIYMEDGCLMVKEAR